MGDGFLRGGNGEWDGTVGVWLSLLLAFREGGVRSETPTDPWEVELPPKEEAFAPPFSLTGDPDDDASSATGPTSIWVRCLLFDRGSLTSVLSDSNPPRPLKPDVVVVAVAVEPPLTAAPPPCWNIPELDEVDGDGIADVETALCLYDDGEVGD